MVLGFALGRLGVFGFWFSLVEFLFGLLVFSVGVFLFIVRGREFFVFVFFRSFLGWFVFR